MYIISFIRLLKLLFYIYIFYDSYDSIYTHIFTPDISTTIKRLCK